MIQIQIDGPPNSGSVMICGPGADLQLLIGSTILILSPSSANKVHSGKWYSMLIDDSTVMIVGVVTIDIYYQNAIKHSTTKAPCMIMIISPRT